MKTMVLFLALALLPAAVVAQEAAPQGGGVLRVTKQHQVVEGDTLWDLAARYYSDPFKWGKIYNANMALVGNPDLILPAWELQIPGLTEEIKAAAPVMAETVVDVRPLPPVEELFPAPAALPAQPAPAVRSSQGMGSFQQLPELSEEMPEDQKEWGSFLHTTLAGPEWKEDGQVTGLADAGDDDEGLSFNGKTVSVRMDSAVRAIAGDYLEVYKVGSTVTREGKEVGKEIQRVALLEVISGDGRNLKARVLDANTSVTKGLSLKKK